MEIFKTKPQQTQQLSPLSHQLDPRNRNE